MTSFCIVQGTQATQYMRLNLKEVNLEIVMKGIRKMQKLRFLHVYFGQPKSELDSQYLPNALQYLHWYGYPFCCLPNTFQGDNLVVLKMNRSKILRLWEGEEKKVNIWFIRWFVITPIFILFFFMLGS